jgi:hypothetical protein
MPPDVFGELLCLNPHYVRIWEFKKNVEFVLRLLLIHLGTNPTQVLHVFFLPQILKVPVLNFIRSTRIIDVLDLRWLIVVFCHVVPSLPSDQQVRSNFRVHPGQSSTSTFGLYHQFSAVQYK